MKLETLDLVVLVAYMAAMVALGIYLGRGQKTGDDYMVGGRNLPWWALLGSIVATETSTVTFLSVPGIAYGGGLGGTTGDFRFLQLAIGYVIGRLFVSWLLLPRYFEGQMLTAYEVLSKRFGGVLRQVASLMFIIMRTLADGVRLYLTAVVLQVSTGLEDWLCAVVIGIATIVYTFFGGMRAVVWTDVIQLFVYTIGAVIAFALLLGGLEGGWDAVAAQAQAEHRFEMISWAFDLEDPYVLWAGVFGGAILTFGTHGVDQMLVQRYLCARSLGDARKALVGSGVVVFLQFAFFLLLGAGLATWYAQHPPATPFAKSDEVFAKFIVHALPAGIVGIVLGAVFSAAMSTLSSSISSSATALVNDFLTAPEQKGNHARTLWLTRTAVIVFGVGQILVGVVDWSDTPVVGVVLAIASITTGVLIGVFALGSWTRVSHDAALTGLCCGLAVVLTVKFKVPDWTGFALAWPWMAMLGAAVTIVCGLAAHSVLPTKSTAP